MNGMVILTLILTLFQFAYSENAEWQIVEVSTKPIIGETYYGKSKVKVNMGIRNISKREMFIWGANLGGNHNLYQIHSFVKDVKSDEWERGAEIGGLHGKIGWIRVDPGEAIWVTKFFFEEYVGRQMILKFLRTYSESDTQGGEILLGPFEIPEAKMIEKQTASDRQNTVSAEKPVLVWRDSETNRVVFTSDDIITFDWDKQMFQLTEDAVVEFCGDTLVCSSPGMIIEDENGAIYETCWYNPILSYGCSYNPVCKLWENLHFFRQPAFFPFISIEKGIPGWKNEAEEEKDRRFDPRLRAGLEKAGVLGSINLDSLYVELISISTSSEPKVVGEDLKVWVRMGSFRLNRYAPLGLLFRGGEKTLKKVDSFALEIKLAANDGSFRSDTLMENIPVDVIKMGAYSCEFDAWQPAEGSDKFPEVGPGFVSLAVLFSKNAKTVYRLEIPEKSVLIYK
jgi:hypothetical protein